jgi:membrane-bound serine protease (ClpP class)
VKLGVVDFESRDLDTLLQDLDGRQVAKGGHTYTLQTARAGIERYDMSGFDQFLQAVADPNLVYLLFLLAIIGIGFWVTHPGLFLPGVIGVIAGVLAALSMFDLPINIAGLILILIAVVLFIIDLKAVTHGVLTTGGIVAMTLGGLLLINTSFLAEGVNIPLLLITVLVIAAIFLFILRKLIDARRRPYAAGEESMIGMVGSVRWCSSMARCGRPPQPAGRSMPERRCAWWESTDFVSGSKPCTNSKLGGRRGRRLHRRDNT